MRRVIISFLLFLFCSAGFAQERYPSLLWEVSGNGLTKKSYLYGTIHVKDARVFEFGDSTKWAYKQTQAMAGELVIDKDSVKKMMNFVLLPSGITLESLLSAEDYKLVKKVCKKNLGIYAMLVDRLKPIYTVALLTEKMAEKPDMPQRNYTLDEYLQEFAKEMNKPVFGLETVREQMQALDFMSLEEQAAALVEVAKMNPKELSGFDDMVEIYLTQDLDSLMTYMYSMPDYTESFDQALVIKRNKIMAERMDTLMRHYSTFVAIGSAHLPGENGVISLLRQKGFTVRAVYSPFRKEEE